MSKLNGDETGQLLDEESATQDQRHDEEKHEEPNHLLLRDFC